MLTDEPLSWDIIPEEMNKEEFCRICRISKTTATYLLRSGKVPCQYNGKKTRCYRIRREDVIVYLEGHRVFPESYSAPAGWYRNTCPIQMPVTLPAEVETALKTFFTEVVQDLPDVMKVAEVARLTGYGTTIIHAWCRDERVKSFRQGKVRYIPKVYLVAFFSSAYFRSITRKSPWHLKMLRRFARWQKLHGC